VSTRRSEAHRVENRLQVERVTQLVLIEERDIVHVSVRVWGGVGVDDTTHGTRG
jgi:hypothetical protein